jgi:hypothetical protein
VIANLETGSEGTKSPNAWVELGGQDLDTCSCHCSLLRRQICMSGCRSRISCVERVVHGERRLSNCQCGEWLCDITGLAAKTGTRQIRRLLLNPSFGIVKEAQESVGCRWRPRYCDTVGAALEDV